jgi:steroid delta-isomerase-like uncharacterized protein
MAHPNEERLRELYAVFATGDLAGFLAGCADDVTFTVPGRTPGSGVFTKSDFTEWITGVIGATGGTFREHVLDVFANDSHGVLLLRHEFDRDGVHREYRTAHICELRDGRIARWTEHPGSLDEFEDAWGRVDGDRWMDRYLEAWDSHDGAQVAAFMADDASYEDLALGVVHEGRDAIGAFASDADTFSSDYRFTPISAQQDGRSYCLEWEMSGTNDGEAGGLPATHKSYRIRGVSVGVLDEQGLIQINRDYWNLADYLTQVGILPPPEGN